MPTASYKLELKALLRLAGPLAAVHAGIQMLSLVDTAIVGRLGAAALGGVGLANALYFGIGIVGMGVMMGLDPLMSQALGAGDAHRARRLLWQAGWLSLLAAGPLMLVMLACLPVFDLAGVDAEAAREARVYLLVRTFGTVPWFLFVGLRSYMQSVGRTLALVLAVVVGNVVNLLASLLLVFGGEALPAFAGPLRAVPAFGVAGAAVATVLCTLFMLAVVGVAAHRLPSPPLDRAARLPCWSILGKAVRLGAPIGLQLGAEVGLFTLVAFLAGQLGAEQLAAHQIALTLAGFSFTLALGVGAAGSVQVGRAIGAGDARRTRLAGLVSFAGGGAVMACWAIVFALFPAAAARLLTDTREVLTIATSLGVVAAVFQLSDGVQAVGAGVLRGAGDTSFAFVANLVGHYAIGLPVAVELGLRRGLGVIGLWWGLFAALTAVALTLFVRFLVLSRRPIRPVDPPQVEPDLEVAAEG